SRHPAVFAPGSTLSYPSGRLVAKRTSTGARPVSWGSALLGGMAGVDAEEVAVVGRQVPARVAGHAGQQLVAGAGAPRSVEVERHPLGVDVELHGPNRASAFEDPGQAGGRLLVGR